MLQAIKINCVVFTAIMKAPYLISDVNWFLEQTMEVNSEVFRPMSGLIQFENIIIYS